MSKQHVILGTGAIGLAVMRALIRRQETQIRMVNRSGHADVPPQVEVISGDLYNPDDAIRVTRHADIIYQCAQPHYHEWPEKFPPLQHSIIKAAQHHDAMLVVAENLYMYGNVEGLIHEDLPYQYHTKKGTVRADMATELLELSRQGKLNVAIARGSDYYGPYTGAQSMLGDRVMPQVLAGKNTQAIGDIDMPHSYTFIDDFGKTMVTLGCDERALGDVWHVPNAPAQSTREMIDTAYQLAGTSGQASGMNKLMLRIVGLFIPNVREIVEMYYEFDQPFEVDSSKFEETFGIRATPIEDGIQQTLDWYRVNR